MNIADQINAAQSMAIARFLSAYVPGPEAAAHFQADIERAKEEAKLAVYRDACVLARAEAIVERREFTSVRPI